MCWFLTDKFLACWLQIYFYKIDAYVNHHSLALCLLSTHLLTNKKVCRQPIDQLFFKAERNCSLTLSLFFIYSCSWKSHIMRTARLHDITTNTASIDSSVILNQCPSHGITLFFLCPKHCAIGVVACSTVFSGYWLTVVLICLKYLLWNCVIIFWDSFLFIYSTVLFFIASTYVAQVF